MKDKYIITELKNFLDKNIFEQAQLTTKNEILTKNLGRVYVVGGGYNGGQREHGEPHFKLTKNDGEDVRILIPIKKPSILTLEDIIVLDNRELDRKSKKNLLQWLKSSSEHSKIISNIDRTNLENIASMWNSLNYYDENVVVIDMKMLN